MDVDDARLLWNCWYGAYRRILDGIRGTSQPLDAPTGPFYEKSSKNLVKITDFHVKMTFQHSYKLLETPDHD